MTQITHGMNPEEVDSLGVELQRMSDDMDRIARQLENHIASTSWVGPDASRFKTQWWPSHRTRLSQAATDLRGFGQSAKNNASEQRQASNGNVSTGGAAGVGGVAPSPNGGSVTPGAGQVNGFPGWGQPLDDATAKAIADKYIPPGERTAYDFNGAKDGAGDWYQCTAWAKARWRQMGYTGPNWHGDGGSVAHNVNTLLGQSDSHTPTVGALMSRPGHVGVVEEVRTLQDGTVQFRVSEMNMNGGSEAQINLATADEFQISGWTTATSRHTFAAFPG